MGRALVLRATGRGRATRCERMFTGGQAVVQQGNLALLAIEHVAKFLCRTLEVGET